MTRDLTALRQEINNFDRSVVVLELAMNLTLYGLIVLRRDLFVYHDDSLTS